MHVGERAHVVMVCDRENGQVRPSVNGVAQDARSLPAGFAGNYNAGGNLSVGSGWQNFWGAMDEVSLHRRALTGAEVATAFRAMRGAFGVVESPELRAMERRGAAAAAFEAVNQAWATGDHHAVRSQLATIIGNPEQPPHFRSYAHLRLAQSHLTTGDAAGARREYQAIADQTDYPQVHRYEAGELIRELDRTAQGLPPRDPAAPRTQIPLIDQFAAEVFVAPDGDDAGDGSRARPFRSFNRARDAVRALKAGGTQGPIGVRILPGEYPVTESLKLTAEDSGSEGSPVVYRAEEMGRAVFYGGRRIGGFVPVADPAVLDRLPEEARGKVWQSDLRAQGITDFGALRVRGGIGQPPPPPTLELYYDAQPMTLARWPNQGFVGIRELIQSGSKAEKTPSIFGYLDDRHARWTQAEDAWLRGYWLFLWADATIKIGSIDPEAKTITTAEPYHYGGRGMSNQQGIIYYAFNLLEEIDQPGEWYLNRDSGILYFYPPGNPDEATIEIGLLAETMLVMENVAQVRFEGLTFDLGRYDGLLLNNCTDSLIAGCTVSRMAGEGVAINGGKNNGLFGCDLHTLGRRGSIVSGGNRETLEPANHFVENCQIHYFGRIDSTYTQAISLGGVGLRAAYNLLYNCPTSVFSIGGNDHLIQFNDVHSAVQESDDQGGVDMWGNPTFRGNIFRYNMFRHVGKTGSETAVHGQASIRFDDAISGQLVYGNIFYRGSNANFGAVQMNSGRDNIMDNNLFVDNRHGISGGWYPGNQHWKETQEGKKADAYTNELYLERYPEIGHMFDDQGVNHAWRNVFYRCGQIVRRPNHMELLENAVFADDEDPGFVDLASLDFHLRQDAPVFRKIAFRPIPVAEIGLYAHPLRASWPVRTTLAVLPDWRATAEKVEEAKVRPHPMAPVPVKRVPAVPRIDGELSPGEWGVAPVQLRESPSREALAGPPAEAWLMHNGETLHIAIRIPVANAATMPRDGVWGGVDGLEICLRETTDTAAGKRPPVLILQGFPGGRHQGAATSEELSTREAAALATVSRFAAAIRDDAWTAEWAIPIPAIGLAYSPGVRLQFNIGVRRSEPSDWIALAGALGPNHSLDNATFIILE
jgi:hypothetical protein